MTTIELFAKNEVLELVKSPTVSSGDVNEVELYVEFSEEWLGFAKVAVFFNDELQEPFEQLLENGRCKVPSEVIKNHVPFYVGIRGAKDNSLKTTDIVKYTVIKGVPAIIKQPNVDIYQQILAGYAKLETIRNEVDTDAKQVATDRAEVKKMVDSVEGIGEHVAKVERLAGEAQQSATLAGHNATEATQAKAQAETAKAGAETAAGKTAEDRTAVNQARTAVEELQRAVKADRTAVEEVKQSVEQLGNAIPESTQAGLQEVNQAKRTAVDEITRTGTTHKKAVEDAGTTSVQSINNFKDDALRAVETAKTDATVVITAEGTKQVGLVTAEGTKQVEAVQDAANIIVADREQIAQNKSRITELNETLRKINIQLDDINLTSLDATEEHIGQIDVLNGQYIWKNLSNLKYGYKLIHVYPGDKVEVGCDISGQTCNIAVLTNYDKPIEGGNVSLSTNFNFSKLLNIHDRTILTMPDDAMYLFVGIKDPFHPKPTILKINWIDYLKRISINLANIFEEIHNTLIISDENSKKAIHILDRVKNINKFDKNTEITRNQFITQNGTIATSNERYFCITAPIFLDSGSYKMPFAFDKAYFVETDFIHCEPNGGTIEYLKGQYDRDTKLYTANITKQGYYRFNFYDNAATGYSIDNFMICKEEEYPSEYVPFAYYLGAEFESNQNVLFDKTIIWDGDSICYGAEDDKEKHGWASRIAEKNKMKGKNFAVSGGTITSECYIDSKATHWVSANVETMYNEFPNADYIIFEGGTNDADILKSKDSNRFGTFSMTDYNGNYDINTFCGALENMFCKAIKLWKGKKIAYVVAIKMGGANWWQNRYDFFDTAMKICKKWGIPYLNLWDCCVMNPEIVEHYDKSMSLIQNKENGKLYADGQHPTAKGYDFLASIVENWLRTL